MTRKQGVRCWAAATVMCCVFALVGAPGVLAAHWSEPVQLSPTVWEGEEPQVAVDEGGDEAVVWRRRIDPYQANVELSVKPAGGTFSAPITITEAEGQNDSPSVALGPEGRLLIVWDVQVSTEYTVHEIVVGSWGSVTGGSFTAPETISGLEPGAGNMRPRAAISQKGESLAVWRGLDDKMHYATSASGKAAFSAPHEIVNPSETLDDQIVAFAPSGAAVVAWKGSFHVYAAVRDPGGSFAPTQGVEAESCSGGDFHAAIDDAGAAVLDWSSDWRRLSSEKECEVGGTPTWLRAAYRAPGHSFDAPVNAAEMDGWSDAGGVTVSGTGRATISAKGWMLSPSSPSYETALTRLPDGSYGDAQTIVREAPVEEPALLAEDAVGDLYSVAGVRTYEEMGEPGDAGPVSGMLANLAPAGGGFAAEAASLLTGRGEFFSAPVIAAAGREHAATAWQAGRRIELSDIQPGEPPANPSETPLPAPVVPPVGTGSTGTGLTGSSTVTDGKAVAGASGGVAGTIATRAAAHLPVTEPRLTVTGRSDRAIAVSVRLLSRGRVIRSVHARLLRGRFTARIEITGLAPGHYRLEIVRRRGTRQHTEDRAVNVG